MLSHGQEAEFIDERKEWIMVALLLTPPLVLPPGTAGCFRISENWNSTSYLRVSTLAESTQDCASTLPFICHGCWASAGEGGERDELVDLLKEAGY